MFGEIGIRSVGEWRSSFRMRRELSQDDAIENLQEKIDEEDKDLLSVELLKHR